MGRYERAARNSLKEATALASGIIDSVRHDLRREEVRLEEEMTDRVESIQTILIQFMLLEHYQFINQPTLGLLGLKFQNGVVQVLVYLMSMLIIII